ncbi:hypothetical protein [Clostridium ihumii]|uniref:DUF7210 family protein n=1 Tax=Clostridium ihumii TaxID=1470356 RepID=UPI00058E521C|nr:hypothetical protein [Clostridium ihumii]
MAGKSDKVINENLEINKDEKDKIEEFINVRALVNIKYDKEVYKIGDEFTIRKENSQDMLEKEYVELAGE